MQVPSITTRYTTGALLEHSGSTIQYSAGQDTYTEYIVIDDLDIEFDLYCLGYLEELIEVPEDSVSASYVLSKSVPED